MGELRVALVAHDEKKAGFAWVAQHCAVQRLRSLVATGGTMADLFVDPLSPRIPTTSM